MTKVESAIINFIRQNPGCRKLDVKMSLEELGKQRVQYSLAALIKRGLIEDTGGPWPKPAVLELTDEGKQCVGSTATYSVGSSATYSVQELPEPDEEPAATNKHEQTGAAGRAKVAGAEYSVQCNVNGSDIYVYSRTLRVTSDSIVIVDGWVYADDIDWDNATVIKWRKL